MAIEVIRDTIANACQQERRTGALQARFECDLPRLDQRLQLPPQHPAQQLVHFVERYIEYVPDFIESAHRISALSGYVEKVTPFLDLAEGFFLAPPEEIGADTGLIALLDEAFLAQRLIEEVNDRHIARYRHALLPMDTTRANIIVHHLLGDTVANVLDHLIEQTVSRLIDAGQLFQPPGQEPEMATLAPESWQDLPCLSRTAEVDLRL